MFRCSQKFSAATTQKVMFHLLSNWIFWKNFVNAGKQPKPSREKSRSSSVLMNKHHHHHLKIACRRKKSVKEIDHRGVVYLLGTLRSNDTDDNENVKKKKGLISKTAISHMHHTFLYISFPFLHDCDVKMPNFTFYGGLKKATTKFYFSF